MGKPAFSILLRVWHTFFVVVFYLMKIKLLNVKKNSLMNVSRRVWFFQGAKFILVHTRRRWDGAMAMWGGWGQWRQQALMKAEPPGCC